MAEKPAPVDSKLLWSYNCATLKYPCIGNFDLRTSVMRKQRLKLFIDGQKAKKREKKLIWKKGIHLWEWTLIINLEFELRQHKTTFAADPLRLLFKLWEKRQNELVPWLTVHKEKAWMAIHGPTATKFLLCSEPQPLRAFYYEKVVIVTVDKEFFFPKVSDKHLGESDLVEEFKFV